jgi:SAM-dependent methyltransferase
MPSYVETMRERFKGDTRVEVVDGDLSAAASLPDFAPADSAICINVIEHIEDDKQALRNIRERLTPDGKLIVLVPAHPWLFNSLDEAVGHFRRYTRDTLTASLTAGGWKIEKLMYFNSFSIPAWILSGNKETPGSTMTKVGSALMPLLSWFDRNIARGSFGISLIAIVTKA